MTISDINDRLIEEFGRISTANAPNPDDGGGNFLSTVASGNVLNYWVPWEQLPGLPCVMVCPSKRKYAPGNGDSAYDSFGITVTFEIHGRVTSYTGTTGGQINAAIACDNLINDCIRVARSLFLSDLNVVGTRFHIVPGPIETMPWRKDGNNYGFVFSLNFATTGIVKVI